MKKALLGYVVCPYCKTKFTLEVEKEKKGEIIEGKLKCPKNHLYLITEGIPRLLEEKNLENSKRQVQSSFNEKWKPETEATLKDKDFYNEWYLERYGFKNLEGLKEFLKDKKFILDAGTGLGRDSNFFSENSEGVVFGIDISKGIDVAYSRFNKINTHFIQGDITKLPFKKDFFDYISCDFVIHHTPKPEQTFKHLLSHLRPQGQIAIYTYKVKGPIREFTDNFLREKITKKSFEEGYKVCEPITKLGKALSDLNIEFEVPEDIPLLEIKAGKYNLQRFIYWNFIKCYWNNDLDFKDNVLVNVDWYHPNLAYRYKPSEIKKWAKDLEIINFHICESGISMRVKKP